MAAEWGVLGYGGDAAGAWADVRGSKFLQALSVDLELRGVKCVIVGGGGGTFRVVARGIDSGGLFRTAILAGSRIATQNRGAT